MMRTVRPNAHLVRIGNWNADLEFQEEQVRFLKRFQKEFLDADLWNPKLHQVGQESELTRGGLQRL